MLTIFKSPASADVTMFGTNAREILAVLGKSPNDRQGVLTVAQLPAQIDSLLAAIAAEKALPSGQQLRDGNTDEPLEAIRFVQRALPLLDLLKRSLNEKVPVTWGV